MDFCAPYLILLREDCGQRRHDLREVFNALRWMIRAGAPWRLISHSFARVARCRRLARDDEQLAGPHCVDFAWLLLARMTFEFHEV